MRDIWGQVDFGSTLAFWTLSCCLIPVNICCRVVVLIAFVSASKIAVVCVYCVVSWVSFLSNGCSTADDTVMPSISKQSSPVT